MSQVETMYDQFLSQLADKLGNIDSTFAMRLMYLERKLSCLKCGDSPHVVLSIEYFPRINREEKQFVLREKYSLEVELVDDPNKVNAMGCMHLEDVRRISLDPDIKRITGKATPTVRA